MQNKNFTSNPNSNHQARNKDWWEKNPMTYKFDEANKTGDTYGFSKHPNKQKITKTIFKEIDNEFFSWLLSLLTLNHLMFLFQK